MNVGVFVVSVALASVMLALEEATGPIVEQSVIVFSGSGCWLNQFPVRTLILAREPARHTGLDQPVGLASGMRWIPFAAATTGPRQ